MKAFVALALLLAASFDSAGLAQDKQDPKPVQNRDEILKQDIENAIKKLGSDRYTESYVAKAELEDLGRRAVPAVVAELNRKEATPAVKRACCEILGAIRDPNRDALAALTARLKDTDEYGVSIASAAARALAKIADDSSTPVLLEALKSKVVDTDRVLKYECIRAMGILRVKESVDLLKKALEDKRTASIGETDDGPLVSAAAAEALGLIRAQDAVEDLAGKLSDVQRDPASEQSLNVHAARALQRILEHEFRGKTEKDEPRLGVLAGDEADVKKTVDAWQKWAGSRRAKKDIEDTKGRIAKIAAAVEAYKKEQGKYPIVLGDLKTKPSTVTNYPKDGYYSGELKDAWGMDFVYRDKGTGADFDIVSYGADRRSSGGGDNADLWNHDKWREAKRAETKKVIEDTVKVINQFKADNERYPEKITDLVSRPVSYTVKKWPEGGYLKGPPQDAYGHYLKYFPGATAGEPFDVGSLGADNAEGGTDENEDLWNHDKRAKKEEPKKDEKK